MVMSPKIASSIPLKSSSSFSKDGRDEVDVCVDEEVMEDDLVCRDSCRSWCECECECDGR